MHACIKAAFFYTCKPERYKLDNSECILLCKTYIFSDMIFQSSFADHTESIHRGVKLLKDIQCKRAFVIFSPLTLFSDHIQQRASFVVTHEDLLSSMCTASFAESYLLGRKTDLKECFFFNPSRSLCLLNLLLFLNNLSGNPSFLSKELFLFL